MRDFPNICILMAVWNGAKFLPAQLQSIALQSHNNWHLIASDDGSNDGSPKIIKDFAKFGHRVTFRQGPAKGASANFMSLVRNWPAHAKPGSWLAFADQDDVWLPDRLERGLKALQNIPADQPALYCSRTWIADAEGVADRLSKPRPRRPGFANALIQNIAAGNTILLNAPAATLVNTAAKESGQVFMHDWWIYQILTGAGATIVHDDAPTLLYRQHPDNLLGANDTVPAKLYRFWRMLRGDFAACNAMNVKALQASMHRFTPDNRARLKAFAKMRESSFWRRINRMNRLGLYRQSRSAHAVLWLSAIIRRV